MRILGKEHLLEKAPEQSWLSSIPYDFQSATHAPANFICSSCELGASTVQPIQDHLWQRSLVMGHNSELTGSDIKTVHLLYSDQCRARIGTDL
ncbi:unnamed protein product [Leptidea sinapis]|uniref:Uncharacterized protein n=1 Tax=Leptidea sinapis TaxID=189913 RepID=A0A5E4QPM0_9NEOP|nr:unnamed protein product [Leptidea sinapis]